MPMFRKSLIVLIILIIATLAGTLYGYYDSQQAISLAPANDTVSMQSNRITVYITGAVNKPSLITVSEGARIGEIVNGAGGLLTTADIDKINMAEYVKDGEHIRIPEKISDSGVGNDEVAYISDSDLININTATEKELVTLPGIGEAMSRRIIEYREKNGNYKTIEDIKLVKGIGEVKFAKLKDKIRI